MQKISINISEKHILHLEALKKELGFASRSQALEMILDQLFEEKDAPMIKPEE